MARPKIFILTHEYPPKRGGAGVYCEEMSFAAKAMGHEVQSWVPQYAKDNEDVKALSLRGTQDWGCSLRLARELRRRAGEIEGQVLHLAEPGALRAIVRFGLGQLKPSRLLITIHGSEIPRFTQFPLERFRFRKLLRKADCIHVLSRYNKTALTQCFPELEKKILLAPGAPSRHVLTNKLFKGEKAGVLSVITVGRLHPRKGQDRVLQALGQLDEKVKSQLEYLVVGPTIKRKYYEKLREQSVATGIPVHFLGDLAPSELSETYASGDLFVLTSMPAKRSVEGFGFVYLEAAAHGLPSIAHKIGGVEDAVIDGETGLLISPEEPMELTQAIKRLVIDSGLRKNLGDAALKHSKRFSWEKTAQALYGKGTT